MSRAESPASTADRVVRSIDVAATDVGAVSNAIEDMYDDVLDVIVIRNAFDRERLSAAGEALDRAGSDPGWARPNEKMPVEDIQLLGTDTPATPTYQAPRGASLDAYLESAKRHRAATESVFDAGFDAAEEFRRVLGAFSGGRPVDIAVNFDGRQYRAIHHPASCGRPADRHSPRLPLPARSLQRPGHATRHAHPHQLRGHASTPEQGGELFVYGVTPQTPDAPKLPNGFSYDLEAIERRFDRARFEVGAGDLFLLASGRCLHRVGLVAGPRARVTMGGFLALEKDHQRVLFWS